MYSKSSMSHQQLLPNPQTLPIPQPPTPFLCPHPPDTPPTAWLPWSAHIGRAQTSLGGTCISWNPSGSSLCPLSRGKKNCNVEFGGNGVRVGRIRDSIG